ncbi:MAG: V-type ATP synthase subunit A [Nitrospirota bacterium]
MKRATATWLSGPVLRARPVEGSFRLREAVHVGDQALLGEVIRIQTDEIVVQVYEDTTGLRPGAEVRGTDRLLAVRLGPALLGKIFDGLLRPVRDISDPYVAPGHQDVATESLRFVPGVQVGNTLAGGAVFGTVGRDPKPGGRCLVPPYLAGEVVDIAAAGEYPEDAPVCRLKDAAGHIHDVAMSHPWSVRDPRPVAARLPGDEPLLTGQRILDGLFPVARGGTAAIPGGFGTGKTVLLETLAKWCSADIIVYVGCGERGNEMASMLGEFVELTDPRTDRPLMERTVIIANTSNMPVAAREASIYTGVSVAEYFRDQGLHVALMADSTSRWAEALREVSGRLGELPGEGGFPAYLSSRLAEFYERAAIVRTLGGEPGSVTVMGAVSPPAGDFSEPVVSHTQRYVSTLWALDPQRAHARFYPAIHPLQSYSEAAPRLARWWHTQGNSRWEELRRRFLILLEQQARLERMARIIGKESLPPSQRLILLCAELVNQAFLRQSAYSHIDRFASPARQTAMMRLLGRFLDLAEEAVAAGVAPERVADLEVYRRLLRHGEEIGEGEEEQFAALQEALERAFVPLIASPAESKGQPVESEVTT